jgi:hypothetical protein
MTPFHRGDSLAQGIDVAYQQIVVAATRQGMGKEISAARAPDTPIVGHVCHP